MTTGARGVYSATLAIEMRAPLARVELAAGELLRGGTTPASRELGVGIREAVADIDQLIAKLLSIWIPFPAASECSDIAPVLQELHGRLSSVMNARGVTLQVSIPPDTPVPGDGEAAREIGLALLRAGAALVGSGGRLELTPVPDSARFGIRLDSRPATASLVVPDDPTPILENLHAAVVKLGGWVEREAQDDWFGSICVWVPREEGACSAS